MGKINSQLWLVVFILALLIPSLTSADTFELSKDKADDIGDGANGTVGPYGFQNTDIALFGVKLGDTENKAVNLLMNKKIPDIKGEKVPAWKTTFILLFGEQRPTGPMAGVRLLDGKVDLIFVNQHFAKLARGIFRTILQSKSPLEVREELEILYAKEGFAVHYEEGNTNIEITVP
ncbi:MAG: hypothetical protein ACREI3_07250 [Nitrospirales bacterium]